MSAAASRSINADPNAPGVQFTALSVGYGPRAVLRNVELGVKRGEILGLVGPNGAGKSTLVKAITGAADVLAGSVEIAGVPLNNLDTNQRARLVAVVPQSLPSLFAFTASEFVAMGRHPHMGRMDSLSDADEAVVARVMELTDTIRLAEERVDTLSGGDLQRLTLAQALAQEPQVLLLDEPTSHLDLNHRLQVLDLVRRLADDGLAVLGVFHDLDLAARYSDRLAVVHDEMVAPCGPPENVLTAQLVREVFAVRAVVGPDAVTGAVAVTPVLREQAVDPIGCRVFVLGGSGAAAGLMRRLALAGFEISAGALSRGDVDHSVADALGVTHVELSPFGEISPADRERVFELASHADIRIVAQLPFGRANLANLEATVAAGAPLMFVGGFEAERDFAGGDASAVVRDAMAAGAVEVTDVDHAVASAVSFARGDR